MSNYHHHHHRRCCGCNRNNFHCPPTGTGRDRCAVLGPFVAIDSKCIIPPQNTGSIIPFSSGITPTILVSALGGLIGTASLVGFGTAIPDVTVTNDTIDLLAPLLTEAFSVPRDGSITSISASFRVTVGITVPGTGTVSARIYRAPAGSSTFTATDASVNLTPALTGVVAVDTTLTGTSANFAPVTVAPGDRLLMVFSITGPTTATTLTGTASAGINIQ